MNKYEEYLKKLENYRIEGKEDLFENERFGLHALLRDDYVSGVLGADAYLDYCNRLTELRYEDFHLELYNNEEVYNILKRIFNVKEENNRLCYHGFFIDLKDSYTHKELKGLVAECFTEVFKRDFTPAIYNLLKKTLKL